MKKIILILMLISISNLNAFNSQTLNQSIKFLKLGNTLREAGDYESSKDYLDKGYKLANKTNDAYWSAIADEYLGYYYRDLSKSKLNENSEYFKAMALAKLEVAIEKFGKLKKNKGNSPIEKIKLEINILKNNNLIDYKGLWLNNTYFTYDEKGLKKIPEDVSPKATYLSLVKNKFSSFPMELLKLRLIEYLDLSDNKLKELPNSIEYLIKLKVLKLKNNKFKDLPEEISYLPNLKYLDISNNGFKRIPDFLTKCKSLEILDLRKNNIPFEELKKLLQKMPNTQILHEKYIIESETGVFQEEDFNE
jgi:hypothetical protein